MSRTPVALMTRLMAKVAEGPDGCWVFTGKLNNHGYGCIWSGPKGRVVYAHRAAFELFRAEIPDGLTLDHLCRNRSCCNPWHLEPVDHRTNMHRSVGFSGVNAAKTGCVNGHEFDETNTYITSDGKRRCRACDRDRHRVATRRTA